MPTAHRGHPSTVRGALHRAAAVALLRLSPLSPLPPHMADLTDLRWGPYPPTFPPRHQTALTGTRTATTAAVPTAACPIGPLGPRSRAQVRTHAARSTHAREVVVVVLAVPPLPSRCASWRAVRVASVCLMSAHAPRAAATLLVIAKATSRVRTSARKCGRPCCCCGCGLLRSPDAGVTWEVRAAPAMHARRWACARA